MDRRQQARRNGGKLGGYGLVDLTARYDIMKRGVSMRNLGTSSTGMMTSLIRTTRQDAARLSRSAGSGSGGGSDKTKTLARGRNTSLPR
jgi:hypothetical protein